jgi:hypothetical protein
VKLQLLVRSSSSSSNLGQMLLATLVYLQGITASRITIAGLAKVLFALGQVLSGDPMKMHLATLVSVQGMSASRIAIAELAGVLSVRGQVLSGDQMKMPRVEVVRP